MVKVNVMRALALVGLMASGNALGASEEFSTQITFDFSGDLTPNVLAEAITFVARDTISERDAVVSIAQAYKAMGNDFAQAIGQLKDADITKIGNRDQFVQDSLGKFMQKMLKLVKSYNMTFAIAQICLVDDGMLDEIGRLMPIKINELLSDINNVEVPENDQEFVAFWYEVLERAVSVGLNEVSVAALTTHYPQYAQEVQAVLNPVITFEVVA